MATEEVERVQLLVAGTRTSGQTRALMEPATGGLLALVEEATLEHVDEALARATEAAAGWAAMPASGRGAVLREAARVLSKRAEDLALLEARNVGKPIRDARAEVGAAIAALEFYAGAAATLEGQVLPVSAPGLDLVLREPVGVCALIVPWNFPLFIAVIKAAPALAAGNPIVLKPAELTPLSALVLGDVLVEAGVPAGCVSVLPGDGPLVGAALAADPRVAKVSFTGSTAVGVAVLRAAAPKIGRVSLELGGKSSNLIFADADLDRAAPAAAAAVFGNAGQDCCARSRVLVQRTVLEAFLERFLEATDALRVGDPLDESTDMGPLVSRSQQARVLEYVEDGRRAGATLLRGGGVPADEALAAGPYVQPTVFGDVASRMRIAQEEIFGPVAMVIAFSDEEEAVALANDVDLGLSGSIWTRDLSRAVRVARGVRSGALSVNSNQSVHVEAPFGGMKRSGLGRELGTEALRQYTEIKNVYIAVD
ncbi:MAG TPA: aldehyde dehydrogenase family protein [Baekduia sp.]|uniref:aldehyde dehydrogenase family protein n=1 Tax=Baekduia sp. TaxID=2600305 RepID=UPI002C2FCBD2|nr:aldehyde dehydrogenase family protein [Baekduia sp.]HMJ36351.1 aldehyde dehydrogenase family protein [Baekduia sp.]